jgi:hypothetical protein
MAVDHTTDVKWVRARPPEGGAHDWAEKRDFDPLLLPFGYRETDPIAVGQQLSSYIEGLRPTAATFAPDEGLDASADRPILGHLLELRGSWQLDSAGRPKFVNPNYVHRGSFDHNTVVDTDERLAVLDRMAATGMPTLFDLAPRFGLSAGELHAFCEAHGVNWRAKRRAGRRRLARTARVAVEWGYSFEAVADALPLSTAALGQWIAEDGQMDYVPQDPSLGIQGGE